MSVFRISSSELVILLRFYLRICEVFRCDYFEHFFVETAAETVVCG